MGVEYYIYRKTPIIENCLIHICDFENISLFVYELCFRVYIYIYKRLICNHLRMRSRSELKLNNTYLKFIDIYHFFHRMGVSGNGKIKMAPTIDSTCQLDEVCVYNSRFVECYEACLGYNQD